MRSSEGHEADTAQMVLIQAIPLVDPAMDRVGVVVE